MTLDSFSAIVGVMLPLALRIFTVKAQTSLIKEVVVTAQA